MQTLQSSVFESWQDATWSCLEVQGPVKRMVSCWICGWYIANARNVFPPKQHPKQTKHMTLKTSGPIEISDNMYPFRSIFSQRDFCIKKTSHTLAASRSRRCKSHNPLRKCRSKNSWMAWIFQGKFPENSNLKLPGPEEHKNGSFEKKCSTTRSLKYNRLLVTS